MVKPYILTAQDMVDVDDDCACPDRAFVLSFAYTDVELEQDCACPDRAYRMNFVGGGQGAFGQAGGVHVQDLPSGCKLLHSPYAPGGPSVLNAEAWQQWLAFVEPRPLQEEIDTELAAQALLQPVGAEFRPTHNQGETLTAWVHVTNACNLDCPYCYVRKSSARMSAEVGLRSVQQVFHTAVANNFRRVKLKYAGGEATLHFKLIQTLHHEASRLAAQTGVQLKEVVLSNGYRIRPEDAAWLKEANIKLMVSLDGVGEMHDQQRPLKGGGSTFTQIERTVDEVLLPHGIQPDITITVTQQNAGGIATAVRWALTRDLPVSLNFYRQNILSSNREDLALEEAAIIAGMEAAYAVFAEFLPTRPFLNGLLDRVQAEAHAHTCGVQHSYLVINHTGQLAQCQMHLDEGQAIPTNPKNLLPIIANGRIQNISVDEKEGCRSCEFRYRCTGGCPLETYRATGRWDVQSPHCHIYKTLFPQALRLEGLRLLKLHGLPH
jgi:uncharacterized protein